MTSTFQRKNDQSYISPSSTKIVPEKNQSVIFYYRQATHKLNIWVGGATSISPPPSNALCNHFAQLRVLLERSWIEKKTRTRSAFTSACSSMNTNNWSNTNSEMSKYQNSALLKSSSANQIRGPELAVV